jgi:hypothetical protein
MTQPINRVLAGRCRRRLIFDLAVIRGFGQSDDLACKLLKLLRKF